jgi:integrase
MAVTQRKDGRWVVYYRDPDRPDKIRYEYFGRGVGAEHAAEKRNTELGFGRKKKRQIRRGPTFGDLALHYATNRELSENSAVLLDHRLRANILPHFAEKYAISLTHLDITRYVEKRRRQGVKDSTIRREMTDVQAILNFAVAWHPPMIPSNPVGRYKLPPADDAVITPPTPDETDAILTHAAGHLKRAILLACYTGLRPGAVEMLSLTWRAVIWHRGVIMISSAHKGGPERREVPIHPELLPMLEAWYQADGSGSGPVIHFRGRPVAALKTAWRQALRRADITRRLRLYDFRHAFVTSALEAGADIKAVSEIVGSRPETLMKHYQHVSRNLRRETMQKIHPLPTK